MDSNGKDPNEKLVLRTPVKVAPDAWRDEPDFSDFIASKKGLDLIEQDLELTLENARRESMGANFPCDVVANIVGDPNHTVIIENQFGRADHDHLGKFLTYAASHGALTCILIAERIVEDHRAAIDWLNDNTPESFSFYAVELRVFRVGNSAIAPMLLPVCKPNFQVKISRSGASPTERANDEWRRQLWEEIRTALKPFEQQFRTQRASSDAWSSISLGRGNCHMNMLLTPSRGVIGLETIFQGPLFGEWFKYVFERKGDVELEIGQQLTWVERRGTRSARVYLEVNINPRDDNSREAVLGWFVQFVPKWHAIFSRIARTLPTEPSDEGEPVQIGY